MGRLKRIPAWIGTVTALLGFVLPILAVARMWVMAGGNVASFRLLTTTNMFPLVAVTLYEGVVYLLPLFLLIIWRLLPLNLRSVLAHKAMDNKNHMAIALIVGVALLITGFFIPLGVWLALVIAAFYISFQIIRTPLLPKSPPILLLPVSRGEHTKGVAPPLTPPTWCLIIAIILCFMSLLLRSWLPLESIRLDGSQVHKDAVVGYVISEDEVDIEILSGIDSRVYRIPHKLVESREICPPRPSRDNAILSYPPFTISDLVYDQQCSDLYGISYYTPSVPDEAPVVVRIFAMGMVGAWFAFFYLALLLRSRSDKKGHRRYTQLESYLVSSVVVGLILASSFTSFL
jgi:hypothetical protein